MPREANRLRALVQIFVRRFGLLDTSRTPCGHPISTSHAHALMTLLEREGAVPQRVLAGALGIDKSNVTRLCTQMEAAGHVSQARDPNDGRSRLLTLTAKGTRLATELGLASHRRFADLLTNIPASERAGVLHALNTLNEALERLSESTP